VDTPKKKAVDAKRYRSLITDGRQVFQLCLETILFGAKRADEIRLSSKLYTNQERFEGICRTLSDASLSIDDRFIAIKSNVEVANRYRFVGETGLKLKTLMAASRLTTKSFLEGGYEAPSELMTLISDLSTSPKDDGYFAALSVVNKIHELYSTEHEQWVRANSYCDELNTLLVLINVVWDYTFMHYYWMRSSDSEDGEALSELDG
jgi:hypothetical protein